MTGVDARFVMWLASETGIDTGSLGDDYVARAIAERIGATQPAAAASQRAGGRTAAPSAAALDAYWTLLQTSPDERRALTELFVVPETWFFRERDAFIAFAHLAAMRLRDDPARVLRVLSAPCSTGEEPYSAAMALVDAGIDPARFAIDAIDISARAIALAANAHYGRNAFRGHRIEFRDRYFRPAADAWILDARVRDCVRFRQANLLDALETGDGTYDFIFCRNVLIYFGRDAQDRVLRGIDARLADDGIVFVGPAETGVVMRHGFASAKIPLAFAFHREHAGENAGAGRREHGALSLKRTGLPGVVADALGGDGAAVRPASRSAAPARWAPLQTDIGTNTGTDAGAALRDWMRRANLATEVGVAWPPGATAGGATREFDASGRTPDARSDGALAREQGQGPAGHAVSPASRPKASTPSTAAASGATTPTATAAAGSSAPQSLDDARALADAGAFAAAEASVRAQLCTAGPSADAYHLLGLIADAQGRTNDAGDFYRKALYLDPAHHEALAHLATLLDIAGDHAGAQWLLQRARRADPGSTPQGPGSSRGRDEPRRR